MLKQHDFNINAKNSVNKKKEEEEAQNSSKTDLNTDLLDYKIEV